MLWPQVDEDTLENVVEKFLGGRRLVESVVDVVEDLELVGGLAQLLSAESAGRANSRSVSEMISLAARKMV